MSLNRLHTKITAPAIAAVLVLLFTVGGAWLFIKDNNLEFGAVKPSALIPSTPYEGDPLTASYKNGAFRFTVNTPEGFSVGELPPDENGGTAIILQNERGEGIQIYVTSGTDATVLTAEDIRDAIPDLEISSPEEVQIGNDHKGVAFLSNNEAFGGASREVWFYFRGNLYQISTYARLDSLLQAMFSTWTFF